jgi:hypothetical protein
MVRKGNLSFILLLFGAFLVGGFFNWTFQLVYGDTSPQFTVSECPVVSSGSEERSGQCPDMKTIENEGNHIGNEQSNTSAPDERTMNEQSVTSMESTSAGLGNPFGP